MVFPWPTVATRIHEDSRRGARPSHGLGLAGPAAANASGTGGEGGVGAVERGRSDPVDG